MAGSGQGAGGGAALPAHVRVAIIGAGFGGLGAGIRLRKAALTDFVILERARRVDLAEYTIIPAGARS